MNVWLIMVALGVGTFAIRLSMLALIHHTALPLIARDALRFVMPAVLAAIVLPAVLYVDDGRFDAGPGNERLLAAVAAAVVAWATSNTWLTIGVGMSALWLMKLV